MKRAMYLILLLGLSSQGVAESPATMRVDYFHSGNHDTEMFSLDQVVIEPLPWSGNMAQPLDKTSRGKYLFEIVDSETGDVAWSRSFSSIYGEWETTGESRRINRSFHESVRFPAQESIFELVIKKRGPGNEFVEVWRIELDPADVLVHRESAMHADHVVAIHESGDPAIKVDLLLMADGYTAGERNDFIAKAQELTEVLFATSPFKERKDDFNVWAVIPPAAESGVSRPSTNTFRDSPVGATYDAFRSERYILTFDNKSMRRIASSAPYDFIEILTNTEVYGGGGIYGLFSTAADLSRFAQMMLNDGQLDGVRILKPETVKRMTTVQNPGAKNTAGNPDHRGLLWDIYPPGPDDTGVNSLQAYGHTGYTGTAIRFYPQKGVYIIALANRVHPDDSARVAQFRREVWRTVGETIMGMRPTGP